MHVIFILTILAVLRQVSTVKVTGEDETYILFDEIREAVNVIKKSKAPSCGGIEAELWQTLGKNGIKTLWHLCSVTWQR